MSNATDRRYAGLKAVSTLTIETVKCADGEGFENKFLLTREEIAAAIRELAKLGRTDRWLNAVEGWAVMVETEDSLEWAFLQGSIWTGYAAD